MAGQATLGAEGNFEEFKVALADHQRRTSFAVVVALTRTASKIRPLLGQDMERVFDRPRPVTTRGIYQINATKAKPVAIVQLKDQFGFNLHNSPQQWLRAQILGGTRRNKRSEVALTRRFPHLAGLQWVPGAGAKLDEYGNITGAMMKRVLADVQAEHEVGYLANRTARSERRNKNYRKQRWFVPAPGSPLDKRARGVWTRKGKKPPVPFMVFVEPGTYRKRFDFPGLGHAHARRIFPGELQTALSQGYGVSRGHNH